MDIETVIKIIQTLANNNLLLIDTGEALTECNIEIHRRKRNDNKKVIFFIVKERK